MANAAYNIDTLLGQTRFHCADTNTASATFDDSELEYCLTQSSSNPMLAAAMALEALATDQARLAYVIQIGQLKRDKRELAGELSARAANLRSLSDIAPAVDSPDQIFTTDNSNDGVIGTMTGW